MTKAIILFVSLILSVAATHHGLASDSDSPRKPPELQTVEQVDLEKYAGLWHQIAFFPTRFQKNCTIDTTAEYSLRSDGKVNVVNECTTTEGKRKEITGKARVVDAQTQARLKVKFFWFAPAGDYWVIQLGKNYEYAVVGTPNRKYLWILSRTPNMNRALYDQILEHVKKQEFDLTRLQVTGKIEE